MSLQKAARHRPSLLKGPRCGRGQAGESLFSTPGRAQQRQPVFVILGRVLAVQRGCSPIHSVGWGDAGALFLPHAAVREMQQRPLLIGREVGRHNSWGAQRVSLGLKKTEQKLGKLSKDFKQLIR